MEMKVYKAAEADGKCYKCGKHVMRGCECFFGRLFLDDATNGDKKEDYQKWTVWQDDSSLKEDGLIDFYVKKDEWEFIYRDKPLNF